MFWFEILNQPAYVELHNFQIKLIFIYGLHYHVLLGYTLIIHFQKLFMRK